MVVDDFVVITLLRHGITKKNQEKKYIGWTDEPLCEEAKLLLQQTSHCYPKPNLVYCSDLIRCVETASILYPNLSISKRKAFREIHFGDWEERTYDQLKEFENYRSWLNDITSCSPPNGEHYQTFKQRIMVGWIEIVEDILKNGASEAVVVTHGGPIRVLLEQFAAEIKSFWEWHISPGEGIQLVFTKNLLKEGKRCISLQAVPLMEKRNG
ncbi:histidine phosphatase family protein [Bacillus taeanensis]|uniref:Histidine phosphatase family protein n=1 Tax=Bacillus taeanensis TaxID=273032 RepID=A0A366XXF6_9BACI|nr:histidine phosphatase family protein [Bacillus taeanensis]RBW70326.1 histidine phosphatase family protein [Bacillus taeanensis]